MSGSFLDTFSKNLIYIWHKMLAKKQQFIMSNLSLNFKL